MNNALVITRIDESVKEEATIVLKAIGLTVSDAVRLLLTKIAQDHVLPFDITTPNKTTIKAIKESRTKKMNKFDSIKDLMADLNEDDWKNNSV